MRRVSIYGLYLCLGMALSTACSTAEDINRVEPNVLTKSALAGEWYHRATVVDKQFSQSNVFVGAECNLDRIQFEIGKDMLIAYRSYEKAVGTEIVNPGHRTMVAAFPIQKHFDIKRGYNPLNGVQNNVIEENEDRPWNQREYMHVDFSTNLAPNAQCNDWIRTGTVSSIARNTNERPDDPWRVRMSDGYIESTVDAMAHVEEDACAQISDWICAPSIVRMKLSFQRVPENNDYVPSEYPDAKAIRHGTTEDGKSCVEGDPGCGHLRDLRMFKTQTESVPCDPQKHNVADCEVESVPLGKRFGFFLTERDIFDRQKGFTVSNRKQYINRWNIWKNSRRKDGSVIPLSERTPKTIVYYLNPSFPPELWSTAKLIGAAWNTVFVNAVAKVRSRCTVEKATAYMMSHNLSDVMKQAGYPIVTAENRVEACKALGEFSERSFPKNAFLSGDAAQGERLFGKMVEIRVNDCNVENVKQFAAEHELEEELESRGIGSVNLSNIESACAVLEWLSEKNHIEPAFTWQQIGDLRYSFLNWTTKAELAAPLGYGPSSADPLTGQILGANANIYGKSLDSYAAWATDIVMMVNGSLSSADAINASLARGTLGSTATFGAGPAAAAASSPSSSSAPASAPASAAASAILASSTAPALTPTDKAAFEALFTERANQIGDANYFSPVTPSDKHAKIMRHFDEYLMNQDMVTLFSKERGMNALNDARAFESARPSNWARPELSSAAWLNSMGVTSALGQMSPMASSSMLTAFQRKIDFFGRHNACFHADMNEPSIKELAEALAGKSWDEVYKTLREQILYATALHEMGHNFGLRHNFKASADALNFYPNFWGVHTGDHLTTTVSGRTSELKVSSIMDYAGRFNGDFGGLGPYDNAAILAGYVNLVEIFDEQAGPIWPETWGPSLSSFHYKDLPILFAGGDADEKITDHYTAVKKKFDGGDLTAKIDVKSLGIKPSPVNMYRRAYMPMEQFFKEKAKRALLSEEERKKTGEGPHDVPYMYCSDHHADKDDLFCNRFDSGASAEEIVDSAAELYDAYYTLNSFRRDRTSFSAQAYMSKTYTRVYQPMLSAYRATYGLWRTPSRIMPAATDYAAAAQKGLNFFNRILQTVEPGQYCLEEDVYEPARPGERCDAPITIDIDQGRYYDSAFSDEFFFKTDRIGNMYDKMLAIMALSDDAAVLSQDHYRRPLRGAVSIGYYRMFGPELVRLMSGIMRDDMGGHMARVRVENGKPVLKYVPLVGASTSDRALPEIRPSRSYMLQNFATVLPMLYFSAGNDTQINFASRARIALVGSKNDPNVSSKVRREVFMDPNTLMRYVAFAPEGDDWLAPGYQLLREANALVDRTPDNEGDWQLAADDMETCAKELDAALKAKDPAAIKTAKRELDEAVSEFQIVDQKLTHKIQQIDLMRQLSDSLAFGN